MNRHTLARSRARIVPRSPLCAAMGFSLVEALIAVVVVAIGLLGIASLILESLRNGHSALLQTQAVNLVSDMQERIRANPEAKSAYECATYPSGPAERNCAPSDAAPAGVNCTARELAEDDLARWQNAVSVALPSDGGASCQGNVVFAAAGGPNEPSTYRVSVSWQERGVFASQRYESNLLLVP